MHQGRRPPPGPGRDSPWGRRGGATGTPVEARPPVASGDAKELRLYGLNAVRAVFAKRPDAIRKLYLSEARIPQVQPLLKWCVANRIGYRVVADEDELRKLAASTHHEGIVADVLRMPPLSLDAWLDALPEGPCCALWLDGVGNPHNLGAILRSAAHFGVSGLLLPAASTLALSGAAARVAEGGAEVVPMVRLPDDEDAIARLRGAGLAIAVSEVDGASDIGTLSLPPRLVWVMGAEADGVGDVVRSFGDFCFTIPGTGAVESLNVSVAAGVLMAQWRMEWCERPSVARVEIPR